MLQTLLTSVDTFFPAILHALSEPLLILTYERRVCFANAAADAVLCAHLGLSLQGDVLVGESQDIHLRMTDAVLAAAATSAGATFCVLLKPRDDGRCPVMHFSRLDDPRHGSAGEPTILGKVCLNDVPQTQDIEQLRQAFGLSQAESDIAMLIMAGLSPRSIAARRNSSQDTVRWHIKNIFSKTYTTRLVDLALQLSAARSPFFSDPPHF